MSNLHALTNAVKYIILWVNYFENFSVNVYPKRLYLQDTGCLETKRKNEKK